MKPALELETYPLTGRFLAGRLRHDMSDSEKAEIEGMVGDLETVEDGTRIVTRGDDCDYSTILVEGFMLRTIDGNDRRHAVSFHVPGDFVDLHCFALRRLDHNIDCVGSAKIAKVPHHKIAHLVAEKPHLARLLWFSTMLDAALHREWIMKLEQLTAPKRIAHIFAEIWRRQEMVGLGFPDGFATPLRQADLADMCGATTIHVNRALSDLRKNEIADFRRGEVRVANRERLEDYGEFEPDYLYGDGSLALRSRRNFDL